MSFVRLLNIFYESVRTLGLWDYKQAIRPTGSQPFWLLTQKRPNCHPLAQTMVVGWRWSWVSRSTFLGLCHLNQIIRRYTIICVTEVCDEFIKKILRTSWEVPTPRIGTAEHHVTLITYLTRIMIYFTMYKNNKLLYFRFFTLTSAPI